MRKAFRFLLIPCVLFIAFVTRAEADQITLSSWIPQFQGVALAQANFLDSVAYIERIDLTAPGISFTTTPQSGPLNTTAQTTSQFLNSSGSQVAINANFFDPCCNAAPEPKGIIGLSVSNGTLVSLPAFGTADAASSLLLSKTNQATVEPPSASGPVDLSNVENAVSGNIIVTGGVDTSSVNPDGDPHDPFGLDPRTGVGVSENGQYLYLIAIDGRQAGYSVGVTNAEEAELMLFLGVFNGINLDGGGSTALVQSDGKGGADLINQPSGGAERYDGNNLGVFADPLAAPEPSSLTELALALVALVAGRRCLCQRYLHQRYFHQPR